MATKSISILSLDLRCSGVNGIPKIMPQPHPDMRPRAVTRTPKSAKDVLVRTVSALERKAMAMKMKTIKLRNMRFMS